MGLSESEKVSEKEQREIAKSTLSRAEVDEFNRRSSERKLSAREKAGIVARDLGGRAVSAGKAVYGAATSPTAKRAAGYVVKAFGRKQAPVMRGSRRIVRGKSAQRARTSAGSAGFGPSIGYPRVGFGPVIRAPSVQNIGPANLDWGFKRKRR